MLTTKLIDNLFVAANFKPLTFILQILIRLQKVKFFGNIYKQSIILFFVYFLNGELVLLVKPVILIYLRNNSKSGCYFTAKPKR